MARITVEDCLQKVNNRFSLIHMASKRVRELRKGAEPTVSAKNRDIVIALREIAAGKVVMVPGDESASLMGNPIDLLSEEVTDRPNQGEIDFLKEEQDIGGVSYFDEKTFGGNTLDEEDFDEEGLEDEVLDQEDFDEEDLDGEDIDLKDFEAD